MAIKQQNATEEAQNETFMPIRVVEVELGQTELPAIVLFDQAVGKRYQRALCLIRLHTQPIGVVELEGIEEEISVRDYLPAIWESLGRRINEHLEHDGLSAITELTPTGLPHGETPRCIEERENFLADAPFVSIVVPTRDRPERLALCLPALLALHYPRYEIIVVDNAPTTNATADLVQQLAEHAPHLQYVREDRPGISVARNRGVQLASGSIIAFTDDDVVVDTYWLAEIVRAFSRYENVACVTGLVLPLKLDTPAQVCYEMYCGFEWEVSSHVVDMAENRPSSLAYPYHTGFFGVGSNAAYTAEFLQRIGGFDKILGNTVVKTGEDSLIFFQVVKNGYKLVYEPNALVHHFNRADFAGLKKQLHSYGIGLTARITKLLVDDPKLLVDFLPRVPYGVFGLLKAKILGPKKNSNQRKPPAEYPKELSKVELMGMLYGPLAYIKGRRASRKVLREK